MFLGDIMGNKGFTLIELLGTVVLLSLVMGIAAYGVTNTINKSKQRSEAIFVGKLDNAIEEYIDLKGSTMVEVNGIQYEFEKCYLTTCYNEATGKYNDGSYYMAWAKQLTSIKMSDLINANILDGQTIVNPANKKKCFNTKDPEIKIFKDEDYVYYYYVDLSGGNTDCEISGDNAIINTLPDNLSKKVGLS